MAREYTSAARRAAAPREASDDPQQLLAWVGADPGRARQALADLDAAASGPAGPLGAAERAALVQVLLAVFPSFTLDGVAFRVMGEMQLLDLCELMRLGRRNVKTVDPAAIAALADFFRGALGETEYERFRDHCREHCTDPDVLSDVMEGIVEDLTDRPTSRPSHFVGGPSTSGPTSKAVSFSTGRVAVDIPATAAPAGPDLLTMTAADFARWQDQQRTRAADPLGLPPTTGREFVSFG